MDLLRFWIWFDFGLRIFIRFIITLQYDLDNVFIV